MTFTKERLLKIKTWRETYGPDSNVVLPAEEAEALAQIALAALESRADADQHIRREVNVGGNTWVQCSNAAFEKAKSEGKHVRELYERPQPAPVVPDAYVRDELGRMMLNGVCEPRIGFGFGWNACRAAMLQGKDEPATDNTAPQFESLAPANATSKPEPSLDAMERALNAYYATDSVREGMLKAYQIMHADVLATRENREPLAVVRNYTCTQHPTLAFAQDEWLIAGDMESAQELADAINALATSAGSGKHGQ